MAESSVIEGIDYGPLAALAGNWSGHDGMDIAPEPDGTEQNPFYDSILFEPIGDVTNAEQQTLAALRYHQVVRRKSDDQVFHNETGYWLWDSKQQWVMQTLTIPRGVSLVAGGRYLSPELSPQSSGSPASASGENFATVIEVHAAIDDADWPIAQSPFMRDNAKTVSFTHKITVDANTLVYFETTVVDIYGRRFDHTDENTLTRG